MMKYCNRKEVADEATFPETVRFVQAVLDQFELYLVPFRDKVYKTKVHTQETVVLYL
jgi:hypothetical protein